MATAAVNLKIERVTEAIEAQTVAIVANLAYPGPANMQNVADAHEEVRTALAEFLAPALRIVGGQ